MSAKEKHLTGMTDEARGAWLSLSRGIQGLAAKPEMDKSHGACLFAFELARICQDIAESLKIDSVKEAMTKLEKGFRRAKKQAQDQPRLDVRAWVFSEWERTRAQYDDNKSAFARDYVRRVFNEYSIKVTERTMRENWI